MRQHSKQFVDRLNVEIRRKHLRDRLQHI
jgi:hypothetical protein